MIWRKSIGPGFSSPIIVSGKLIYLDDIEMKETVHVLDASTGSEIWSAPFSDSYGDEWGSGPRSTPLVDEDRLYVQSCNGEFQCLALNNGKQRWRINFADYGVEFLGSKAREGTAARRGNSGSAVIDQSRIFVPVGSTKGATIVCFDKLTGKELWRALNDEAAYSSLKVGDLAGVRQVVAFTAEALAGLDCQTGKVLWRVPLVTNAKRHAATPVIAGDLVMVNSHTIGVVALRISREDDGLKASEAWVNKEMKINIATPVLVDHHLYSQGPNKDYVCIDARTGKTLWSEPGFGAGRKDYSSTIALGKNLLVLSEDGMLRMIAADPAKYNEIGRAQVCGNTWSFPAYSDGKLYVRDGRELRCFDLMP
ncbi:MAG: PQQ-binding-like beta-propeller repeat protein [Verrucomicrobiota bacterium]